MQHLAAVARQRAQQAGSNCMRVNGHMAGRIAWRINVVVEVAHLVLLAEHRADVLQRRVIKDGNSFADLIERTPARLKRSA